MKMLDLNYIKVKIDYSNFVKMIKKNKWKHLVQIIFRCFLTFIIVINNTIFFPLSSIFAFSTVDTAVSTTTTEHLGASPTMAFISDQVGYTFYVDGTGSCAYSKTTNGGTSWGTAVNIDAQTDCGGIAIWYDGWTPGDSGTYIHVVTHDPSDDDIWYTNLNTTNDSKSTTINVSSGQLATLDQAVNEPSITKATDGALYMAVADTSDSFIYRCTATCTSAVNWSELTNPFTNGDDWVILLPIAGADIILIVWDISANTISSREFENVGGTWEASWNSAATLADDNTTYDGSFSATFDPDTFDIFLAFADDAQTIGGGDDDIKTRKYNGTTWSTTADVATNFPSAGVVGVATAYDNSHDYVYVGYTIIETVNDTTSGVNYVAYSIDAMTTWSAKLGPVNLTSDYITGFRLNLVNSERIASTWYRAQPDDLFFETIADLSSNATDRILVSTSGSQVETLPPNTANNYTGGAFTFKRNSGSTTITSIKITERARISAQSYLTNLDLYYETTDTCNYDGNESLFGTTANFDSSDQIVISGTLNVGTSQICVYPVVDTALGAYGAFSISIKNPKTDIGISSGDIEITIPLVIDDNTNIRQAGLIDPVTIDDSVSTLVGEHNGSSPTVVFTNNQNGYVFYVDSDGKAKYSKTTDGGANWAAGVIVDNQTDVLSVAVWYDQWTPGDSGTLVHVLTADAADIFYTTLNTTNDSLSTTLNISGANQGGGFVGGQNSGSITKASNGAIFAGILDNTDSFVLRCSTSCTSNISNWTEAGTSPIVGAAGDWIILMPLTNGDILAIIWDVSADDLFSKEFEDVAGSWDASFTNIDLNAGENAIYDSAYSATLNPVNNDIYVAYVDDEVVLGGGDADIKTSKYNGTTWSAQAEVLTNVAYPITQLAIAYDSLNSRVHVLYSVLVDDVINNKVSIFSKYSTNAMTSWENEIGSWTYNARREIFAIRTNMLSNQRIYAMWYGAFLDDIFGTTIVDSIGESIAISVSDGSISYGNVSLGQSKSTLVSDLNDKQTVTNDGQTTSTVNIRGQNTSCPWTLSTSVGTDQYIHEFYLNPTTTWWNDLWTKRIKLTIDNSGQNENLTNFPVLVKLNSSRISYGDTQNSGQDIRFVDSDGTLLKHEIERWNESGDSYVWVNVPQIDSSSSTDYIYMYYGNTNANDGQDIQNTWNSNFAGVWHLDEDPSTSAPQIYDSKNNSNNGTSNGSMVSGDSVAGKVAQAVNTDGNDDYVNIPNFAGIDLSTNMTVSFWFKPDNTIDSGISSNLGLLSKSYSNADADNDWGFFWNDAESGSLRFGSYGDFVRTITSTWTANTWYHVAVVVSGTNTANIYVNGQQDNAASDTSIATSPINGTQTTDLKLGLSKVASGDLYLDGEIDEFKITNDAKSANWINAFYLSESDIYLTYASSENAPTITWTKLTTSYQTLVTGLTASSSRSFDLRVTVPSANSCGTSQNVDVTIQAVQD